MLMVEIGSGKNGWIGTITFLIDKLNRLEWSNSYIRSRWQSDGVQNYYSKLSGWNINF